MTYNPDRTGSADLPVYLVLEGDLLIATDITDALNAHGPCRVIHVTSAPEIAAAIATEPRLAAAILELRLTQMQGSDLASDLAARGARLILTAGEADETAVQDLGWFMLIRPFNDDMIRAVLPAERAV